MGIELLMTILALVLVITIHEFSHAVMAYFLGDPTAKLQGRISLNPLKHIDPLGLIMVFLAHIGWEKPTPVNPRFFKHPKRDQALTALAGPFSNLVLALLLAIPVKYMSFDFLPQLHRFIEILLDINILLFIFNMLPFPPLDGSKIIAIFVPRHYEFSYQEYLSKGMIYFFLFILFDSFFLSRIFGYSLLGQFMGTIFAFIKSAIFLGT